MSDGGSKANERLRLVVRTPSQTVIDTHVFSVTAEDHSGRFGLRFGCEPVIAALVPGLLSFRPDPDRAETYVAVDSGILHATRHAVHVAVRRAVICPSLAEVRAQVVLGARAQRAGEASMRAAFDGLYRRMLANFIEEERRR